MARLRLLQAATALIVYMHAFNVAMAFSPRPWDFETVPLFALVRHLSGPFFLLEVLEAKR